MAGWGGNAITGGLPLSASGTVPQDIRERVSINMGFTIATSGTYYYADNTLKDFLYKSTHRLNRILGTTMAYNSLTDTFTVTPEADLQDILVLQVEYLLTKRESHLAVRKAIAVKQGENAINTASSLKDRGNSEIALRKELDMAIMNYLSANGGGKAHWVGSSDLYRKVSYNGTGDGIEYALNAWE